jgi:N-acetylmuramoyl-L-alanine amidase
MLCHALWLWLLGCGAVQALTFRTVVLDPGHGGKDPGAAWYGKLEKRHCLDVALRVEAILKRRGLQVVMTRRTDRFVELADRARLANRYRNAIFVSVHFNANRNTRIRGLEVYYLSSSGKVLGSRILSSLRTRLKTTSGRGLVRGNLKVLRATAMPAVVVEAGYMSNRTEAGRLASPAHRQAIAEAIAAGIMKARG